MELVPDVFQHVVLVVGQILVFLVCLMLFIVFSIWVDEKHTWNKGICKATGRRWKYLGRDERTNLYVWYGGAGIYKPFYFSFN